jgi:hypothetical protein
MTAIEAVDHFANLFHHSMTKTSLKIKFSKGIDPGTAWRSDSSHHPWLYLPSKSST